MKLNLAAFDDDEVAGSAVDYLYAPGNQSKTQSFLKNNGFPSAQEREFGKALQGIEQERKQLADTLRSTVKTPVSTEHYGESDRAFMQGLLGDEEGEREYQKRVANVNAQNAANTRKQNELLNAFKGSQFESLLRPSVPVSGVAQSRTLSATNPTERSVLGPLREHNTTQYFDTKTIPSTTTKSGYNGNESLYAYSGNKTENREKMSDYDEFYASGQTSVYNRLVKLGNAWLNTTDESAREELHAEAELLRGLARNYTSHNELVVFSTVDDALNNVLKNNNAIYRVSDICGVPAAMIASALYRESLFRDPADNRMAESIIYQLRGDASFGIGQVRTKTAIEAENAFYIAHGMPAPNRTQDEMKARLQKKMI